MPESKTTKKHCVSSRRFAMMMGIRLVRWRCRVRIVMLCFRRRTFLPVLGLRGKGAMLTNAELNWNSII